MSIPSLSTPAAVTAALQANAARRHASAPANFATPTNPPTNSSASTVTLSPAARALQASESAASGSGAAATLDFHAVQPDQLLDTINGLIRGGHMDLDESSMLIALLPISADGHPVASAAGGPIDVFAKLNDLIAYSRATNNTAGVIYGEKALAAINRLQGQSVAL